MLQRVCVSFDGQEPFQVDFLILGVVLPGMSYTLLGFGTVFLSHWVLLEIVGEPKVNGQQALEAVK